MGRRMPSGLGRYARRKLHAKRTLVALESADQDPADEPQLTTTCVHFARSPSVSRSLCDDPTPDAIVKNVERQPPLTQYHIVERANIEP
jgi:hypothetical protein